MSRSLSRFWESVNLSSFSLRLNSRLISPTVLILITAIAAVAQSSQPGSTATPASTQTQPSAGQSPAPTNGISTTVQAGVTAPTTVQVAPPEVVPEVNPALR